MPHLIKGLSGPAKGRMIYLKPGDIVIVGRTEDDADVGIGDKALSKTHLQLATDHDRITVEDLNSTNGTFVNDLRVKFQVLNCGDIILAGNSRFEVNFVSGGVERGGGDPRRNSPVPPSRKPEPKPREFTTHKIKDTPTPLSRDFSFEQCASGLIQAIPVKDPPDQMSSIALQIARQYLVTMLVDLERCPELDLSSYSDPKVWTTPQGKRIAFLCEKEPRAIDSVISRCKGHDGLVVLFSIVQVDPLMEFVQRLVELKLCAEYEWYQPTALLKVLAGAAKSKANTIIEPFNAILIENTAAGDWSIFGGKKLPNLLSG